MLQVYSRRECICGMQVADGTHQNSTSSPVAFMHLFHRGIKASILTEEICVKCL